MTVDRELRLGLSPCPNDTFAFWAALHNRVAVPGVRIVVGAIADIETLNRRAVQTDEPPLDITKLSIPALAAVADRFAVVSAGAALGFGCGPLVVRRRDDDRLRSLAQLRGKRVAIPGRMTTAFLLFSLLGRRDCDFVAVPFEQVMPMVARGECDAGLVIHEGRFTCERHGLQPLCDLGELWEQATGGPLPLGVLAMRRDLGDALHARAGHLLARSVEFARREPGLPRAFVRKHCQELDDEVCNRHIALYVNEFTVDLGEAGRAAIDAMLLRGRAAGLLPDGPSPWVDA